MANRETRQHEVYAWAVEAFGLEEASSIPQRAMRLLEEAVEAAQAVGLTERQARHVVRHVYTKPVGHLRQELGGVGVTLLCLAEAAGFSADKAERDEFDRILAKPLEHFRMRNKAKNDAGLKVEV